MCREKVGSVQTKAQAEYAEAEQSRSSDAQKAVVDTGTCHPYKRPLAWSITVVLFDCIHDKTSGQKLYDGDINLSFDEKDLHFDLEPDPSLVPSAEGAQMHNRTASSAPRVELPKRRQWQLVLHPSFRTPQERSPAGSGEQWGAYSQPALTLT
jgi:hypothetical protein